MKICPIFIQYLTKISFLALHLFFVTFGYLMWNIVLSQSLMISSRLANARCIHDQLQFAIKDQSPQVYNIPMPVPTTQKSSQGLATSASSIVFTGVHNHRTGESSVKKAGIGHHQHDYGAEYLSETEIQLSDVIVATTEKRIRRNSNASNVLIDDVDDSVVNISLMEQQSFSQTYVEKNFINAAYKSIRLTIWYDSDFLFFNNTSIEFERLKQGLDRARESIAKLLSVIPIQGNLLLKRVSACGSYWQDDSSTANSQKCGRISSDYDGETCLDDFLVPNHHLSGFATYNRSGSAPNIVHYKDGEGLADTDTVLYVRAHNTRRCTEGNIIAYASSCQLDQFHRPIAGYANFCPNHLSSEQFDTEKFYLPPANNFYKLNDNVSIVCEKRKHVVDYVDSWHRILTPNVVKETAQHFNCSSFGGPLEGSVENPTVSSHWEARFLQPSLMTSSIGLPHLTIIDRITLALFSDSGWYKVNMSLASEMVWGKGAGCEFGSIESCRSKNSSFFCTASSLAHGCHYLHLDKGVCRSDDFLDSCKVYEPVDGLECWNWKNQRNDNLWKGETFSVNSRCFISNLSAKVNNEQIKKSRSKRSLVHEEEGRCYEQRCNDTKTLEIRVRGSSWVLCKSRKRVEIPGYDGSAVCVKITMTFTRLKQHILGITQNQTVIQKKYESFFKRLIPVVDNLIKENDTSVASQPHVVNDLIHFGLKSKLSNTQTCTRAVKELKTAILKGLVVVEWDKKNFTAEQFESTYTLQPCPPINSTRKVQSPNERKDISTSTHPPVKGVSPGVIAAAAVGGVCVSVFAVVWFILYTKSAVSNAIGPITGLGPEVSYQPNSQGSPPSLSESGSVGQLEFNV